MFPDNPIYFRETEKTSCLIGFPESKAPKEGIDKAKSMKAFIKKTKGYHELDCVPEDREHSQLMKTKRKKKSTSM